MRDKGEVSMLIVGGSPVTQNMWYLDALKEQHKAFTGDGKLLTAVAELTLKEYIQGAG